MRTPRQRAPLSQSINVRTMFDEVVPSYDLLNHLMSFGCDFYWRRRAVGQLNVQPGSRILDIAVGTGDLALAAIKLNPKTVVGVDPAGRMLERCLKKSIERGAQDRVQLVCGVAEALPTKNGSFDGAMVAFGVRNFSDVQRGLNEIYRVLKPAATFVALELTRPQNKIFRAIFGVYFQHVVPILGRLISGSAYAYRYLPESVSAFPAHDSFAALLRSVGFRDVQYQPLTFGTCTLYRGIK